MKKFISVSLVLVCLFLFTSCKKEETVTMPPLTAESVSETTTTESLTVSVTFPEGFTVVQIAELLQQNGVCSAADFIRSSNNYDYVKSLGYTFFSGIDEKEKRPFLLEGYIFPDTYEFYRGETAEEALVRFLDNTEQKLTAEYKAKAKATGYTMDEIIAIASIIQEEASEHKHMANVSSVLHNRLESVDYGRLECDVTINYINDCVKDSPYITTDVEAVAENYNTYKCAGVPVGPICNPGIHAIEAALTPAETNYFFFVTDEAWNYYYSETYDEHIEKCAAVGIEG